MSTLTTSPPSTSVIDDDNYRHLMSTIDEIGPLLRSKAADVERNRALDPGVAEQIKDLGFWKLWRPRRLGGFELPLPQYANVIGELARYCPSTAWVTALINGGAWINGMYPERTQTEFYAEGDSHACVVFSSSTSSRRVEGGYVVSGRWPYASGSLNAEWAGVGIDMVDESGAVLDQGLALMPFSEVGYEDTWHMIGMAGTGSNTVVANDVFVPDHRILSYSGAISGVIPSEFTSETLYRAAFGVASSLNVVAPIVGMARGMLDLVREGLDKGRPIAYTNYKRAIDSPAMQLNVADAAQLIHSAQLHLDSATTTVDTAARDGRALSLVERAQVRMDIGYLAQKSREAAHLLLNVAGASAFTLANPLQRQWRDLEVASRHGIINSDISREIYSKAILGLDEQITPLL